MQKQGREIDRDSAISCAELATRGPVGIITSPAEEGLPLSGEGFNLAQPQAVESACLVSERSAQHQLKVHVKDYY